jgi:hypothetical protein
VKRITGGSQTWEEVSVKPEYATFLNNQKINALTRLNRSV